MAGVVSTKEELVLPWAGKESIYSYIKKHLEADGTLPDKYEKLPDADDLFDREKLPLEPGAKDGIFRYLAGMDTGCRTDTKHILKLIRNQVENPGDSTRRTTYLALMEDNLIEYVDSLLENLREQPDIDYTRLYREALWFAKEGAHRGVVKMGIALMSLFKCEDQYELLFTLGKHEEFTLYTAVTIQGIFLDYNLRLFEMAKRVRGWGKIHLVERLWPDSDEIKDWLLRYGCENKIMNEYLAYVCAVNGDLNEALVKHIIDPELYRGAGIIISALINGGPAEDIYGYIHAMPVIANFLRHSETHCVTVDGLLTIHSIQSYLEDDSPYGPPPDWDEDIRKWCLQAAQAIMEREGWPDIILKELRSGDENRLFNAVHAANVLHLDIWPALFELLASDPLNEGLYFNLMGSDDRERVKQLVDFAEAHLPLKDIAAGPEAGEASKPHACLDNILLELGRFEGLGYSLLLAALKSPSVRNRSMALKVLSSWNQAFRTEEILSALSEAESMEPYADIREQMQELLNAAK